MPLKPSYKPLKRTMLERDVSASALREATGIAPSTWTKINHGEWIALTLIAKICENLNCRIEDVIEFVAED